MKCKKCRGNKVVKIQEERINHYTKIVEYICVECNTTNHKAVPTLDAYYTTEKFNF